MLIRSHGWSTLAVAAVAAAGTGWFALRGTWSTYPGYAATATLVAVALLGTGHALRRSRRGRRVGSFVLVSAVLWPLCWADIGQTGPGPFLSLLADNLVWVAFGTGLLSFPDQQPHSRRERVFLVALWSFVGLGAVALALVSRPEWNGFRADAWWPDLAPSRPAFTAMLVLLALGRVVLAVLGALLLLGRARAASGLDRAVLRPALALLLAATVVVVGSSVVQAVRREEATSAAALFLQGLCLLSVPLLLVLCYVRVGLARAEMIETVMRLSRPSDVGSVQSALRAALHDDSLEVLLPRPEHGSCPPTSPGVAVVVPAGERYRRPVLGADGRCLGLVIADPRLREHEETVQGALDAAALGLENAALHAGLRARMAELQATNARLVAVAQAERRRLERDLHDGAQQRMLAIALHVEHAHVSTTDPELRDRLGRIKTEMLTALCEIRDLARGIQPVGLAQAGLGPALQSLTDGMPLPVRVDIPHQRFAQQAESTAFFVASEALSNVVKHSGAAHASVTVEQHEDQLLVMVRDDGTGAVRDDVGSGLQGLRDRVRASGGELRVVASPRTGTLVEASIPCE
ncbi:MAG: histidine kinase [Nocardioidaceae bacterium]